MKIVVVDDDKIIRLGLKKLIERLFSCHRVIENFQNGSVAYDYLVENQEDVDLVITDIKMPIMTGIELIKKSISNLKNPPIFVVLSGYDEFTYVRDAMKYGAYNYLLKPIKNEELKSIIEEVVNEKDKIEKKDRIYNESIEIIKREYFKNLLFTNKDIKLTLKSYLIEDMHLSENYEYKLIILDKCDISLYSKYVEDITSNYKNIDSVIFSNNDNVFIIMYVYIIENVILKDFGSYIESYLKIFSENNINAFVFETTKEVSMLRTQVNLFRNMGEEVFDKNSGKVYHLNNSKNIENDRSKSEESASSTVIRLAKDYIINNYNKNITLKSVADEVFLSQNYLSELFKKETGEGFYDFLSKYRIKKAKEILISTNIKVYEIAQKVGYNDSISFGRAFKKITGISPNSFRNSSVYKKN